MRIKKILTALLALALALAQLAPAVQAAAEGAGGVFAVVEEDAGAPDGSGDGDGGSGNGGDGGGGQAADPSLDGSYYVSIALWHASMNQASMGDVAFERQALVVTAGGRSVIQIGTHPVEVSGYTTAITDVEGANAIQTAPFTTNTKFDGTARAITYLKVFELPLPGVSSAWLPTRIKVPYTPMDAVGAASDGWLSARFRIYWDSIAKAPAGASINPSDSVATGSVGGLTEDAAPAASLADAATGVRLQAAAGVVPKDAALRVSKITSGAEYAKARAALADILGALGAFELFDISLVKSGAAVGIDGVATLTIPIPAGYASDKAAFYRINSDGTATLVRGKASGSGSSSGSSGSNSGSGSSNGSGNGGGSGSVYEVQLNRMGLYALVDATGGQAAGGDDGADIGGVEGADGSGAAPSAGGDISRFADISGHWALDGIRFAVENGLFNGVSSTEFAPDSTMTRAMFVTALSRLDGIDAEGWPESGFADVEAGAWYAPAVGWAAAVGIAEGVGGGMFAPGAPVTRQEMAALLARYADFAGIALSSGEAPAETPAEVSAETPAETTAEVSAETPAEAPAEASAETLAETPAEVSAEAPAPAFADESSISEWARGAVARLAAAGLIVGVGGGEYAPQKTATRAEVATLFARFAQGYS